MGTVKQINNENGTQYFYNDFIDLQNFKSNLLKIEKKSFKDFGICNTGYITVYKIDDCENISSANPLYLRIAHASGYIEEKGLNKYLVFDSTDGNEKNTMTFLMELGMKSKQLMVARKMIMKKIT